MNNLLIKLFIKDHSNLKNPKVRAKYGTLAGILGIISNLLLSITKIVLGLLTFSMAILADGFNNLTDVFSSIITTIGFKISSTPADEKHPFGHERVEYITGLILSFLILLMGFSITKETIIKLINASSNSIVTDLTILIMVISILIKLWQASFYKKTAKLIDSKTLIASYKDSLNDALSSLAIIVGLIVIKITSFIIIDNIISLLVSLFIIISGLKMAIETANLLIGTKPSQQEIDEIIKAVLEYDNVLGVHDLIIHHYGKCTTFASIHVEMASTMNIVNAHNIIDNIERDLAKRFAIKMTIHLDPVEIDNPRVNELKTQITKIIHDIDNTLSIHDFRVIFGDDFTKILFDVVMTKKINCTTNELDELLTSEIKKIDEKYLPIINIDQVYNCKTDDKN